MLLRRGFIFGPSEIAMRLTRVPPDVALALSGYDDNSSLRVASRRRRDRFSGPSIAGSIVVGSQANHAIGADISVAARSGWPQMFTTWSALPAAHVSAVRVEVVITGQVRRVRRSTNPLEPDLTIAELREMSYAHSITYPMARLQDLPAVRGESVFTPGSATPYGLAAAPGQSKGLAWGGTVARSGTPIHRGIYNIAVADAEKSGATKPDVTSWPPVGEAWAWAHPNHAFAWVSDAVAGSRQLRPYISIDPGKPRWAIQVSPNLSRPAGWVNTVIGSYTETIEQPGAPWSPSVATSPIFASEIPGPTAYDGLTAYLPGFGLIGWIRGIDAWQSSGVATSGRGWPTIPVINDRHYQPPYPGNAPGRNSWGVLGLGHSIGGTMVTPNYAPIISAESGDPYVRTPPGMRLHTWDYGPSGAWIDHPDTIEFSNSTQVEVHVWLESTL